MKGTGRRGAVLLVALAMVAGLFATASATPTTVTAEADAFVLSGSPNANRGSVSTVRIRNSLKFSYLRFDVSGLPPGETVSSATLQVYALGGSKCTLGAEVLRAANDTWG